MSGGYLGWRMPFWPRSLFARLTLSWMLALLTGHVVEIAWSVYSGIREESAAVSNSLTRDVSNLVAILETVPTSERPFWLQRFKHEQYHFVLGSPIQKSTGGAHISNNVLGAIEQQLGPGYVLTVNAPLSAERDVALNLILHDGTPLSVQISHYKLRHTTSMLGGIIFFVQLLSLALITWVAVRQATRPLQQLVTSADKLGTSLTCEPLSEEGPVEVARAAAAFNKMQRRITDHLSERMQILAAISHDLQTPITRMRLRTDLMESAEQRQKLNGDLDTMQNLVEEGIAYARSAHSTAEIICRVDLDALLESIVFDYQDVKQDIQLHGRFGQALATRPNALRRLLSNLIDNALKYSDSVELSVSIDDQQYLSIAVLDRGPGIPHDELQAVLQPFYRVEGSRNRLTGGTGLGLAIAYQLSLAIGATLVLSNRLEGGLEAKLSLPITA